MKEASKLSANEKSVYTYIHDAYLANDWIYTFCSSRDSHNDYKRNTILKFSIHNDMKLAATYILPHDISFRTTFILLSVYQENIYSLHKKYQEQQSKK